MGSGQEYTEALNFYDLSVDGYCSIAGREYGPCTSGKGPWLVYQLLASVHQKLAPSLRNKIIAWYNNKLSFISLNL